MRSSGRGTPTAETRVLALLLLALATPNGSALLASSATVAEARTASACPQSIAEVDLETYLSQLEVPEPGECTFDPRNGSPVTITATHYADLDGRSGDEVVVRAQTCFMNTGGADISRVLRLHCPGNGEPWSLVEIPVAPVPVSELPGQLRAAMWLEVTGATLQSTADLYAPESADSNPQWTVTATYQFIDGRFEVSTLLLKELGPTPFP